MAIGVLILKLQVPEIARMENATRENKQEIVKIREKRKDPIPPSFAINIDYFRRCDKIKLEKMSKEIISLIKTRKSFTIKKNLKGRDFLYIKN